MSTVRCKPGDLCLIITGSDAGESLTVVRSATRQEVSGAARNATNKPVYLDDSHDDDHFWFVDKDKSWSLIEGDVITDFTIPYATDRQLLPIQPPAQQMIKETDKELTNG